MTLGINIGLNTGELMTVYNGSASVIPAFRGVFFMTSGTGVQVTGIIPDNYAEQSEMNLSYPVVDILAGTPTELNWGGVTVRAIRPGKVGHVIVAGVCICEAAAAPDISANTKYTFNASGIAVATTTSTDIVPLVAVSDGWSLLESQSKDYFDATDSTRYFGVFKVMGNLYTVP